MNPRKPHEPALGGCCPVVELRQYTLHPGRRDELIELFDREFVESQEAVGIHVIGQFRDLDAPDRFVWVRGFEDRESRAETLTAFSLEGSAWRTHREAANATVIDSSDVLLLRPIGGRPPHLARTSGRAAVGTGERPRSRVSVTVCHPVAPVEEFARFFTERVAPVMAETSGSYSDHTQCLTRSRTWSERVLPELKTRLKQEPQHLRLEPTVRSRLR